MFLFKLNELLTRRDKLEFDEFKYFVTKFSGTASAAT
jgi:hypothetical protein